jgi:hypothetical protein
MWSWNALIFTKIGKKWKFTLEKTTKAQKGSRYSSTLFFNLGGRWGRVVNGTPRPLYPRERLGTHFIGGWVGLRAGLDGCGKSRPPPGFDHRAVQPVASRYTDYAIPVPKKKKNWKQHQNSRGQKGDTQQVPYRGPIGYYASTQKKKKSPWRSGVRSLCTDITYGLN